MRLASRQSNEFDCASDHFTSLSFTPFSHVCYVFALSLREQILFIQSNGTLRYILGMEADHCSVVFDTQNFRKNSLSRFGCNLHVS